MWERPGPPSTSQMGSYVSDRPAKNRPRSVRHQPFASIANQNKRGSALADVAAEYWLDVDDWRPIQRFEMAHPHASAVDRGDLDPVQANGIRAVRRARTEDAFLRPEGSPRGCTLKTSRRARSSQVMTITSSPDRRLRRPSSTSGSKTSQASGAPSSACRGADPRSVRGDATLPMGFTSKLVKLFSRSAWVRSIT